MEIKWEDRVPIPGAFTIKIDPMVYGLERVRFLDFIMDGVCVQVCAEIRGPVTEEDMKVALQLARIRYGCGT